MAYSLTDFDSYQAYFLALATAHKQLGAKNFLFGENDVAANEGKAWKGNKLWLEPWQPVRIQDQLSDNYLKEKKGSLWVGGAPASLKFSDRYKQFKDCEIIVEDIISKMLKDRGEELLITRLTSYSYGMAEFSFSATMMVGCRLDFTFLDPEGFAYVADNWNVEE